MDVTLTLPSRFRSRYFLILPLACGVVYFIHNLVFIMGGRVPPALLTHYAGIPAPTTGGTRSFMLLVKGDIAQSFLYNSMTVPYLGLMGVSALFICHNFFAHGKWRIPHGLFLAWVVALLLGRIAKFVIGPAYW